MADRQRIIDEIVKSRGYKVALFSTFNFEIEFFERAILNKIYDNGIRRISLFVDAIEFEKTLASLDERAYNIGLGKKYVVSPVLIDGAFHPKLVLLLGDKKAKLIVASSNIKSSGYERNNEIFNIIEYSDKNPEYKDLIVAAIDYFCNIDTVSYGLDSVLITGSKDFVYYSKSKANGERYFIGNFNRPVLDTAQKIINERIDEIKIAVPYYDKEAGALNDILSLYPDASIKLYIQQGTSTFPYEYKDKYNIVLFDGFSDNSSSSRNNFYHGKVFLFKGEKHSYILYGSANCTHSALTRLYSNGGNLECDILDVGERDEFDMFFDNMHISKDKDIISKELEYETTSPDPLRFIFAETNKQGITCTFRSNGDYKKLGFTYIDNLLEYEEKDREYFVYIPKEMAENMPLVFDLTIKCDDNEIVLKCWVIDRYSLGMHRRDASERDTLDDFDPNSEGDKYREDYYNLLKAELMCAEEVQEYRKMKALLNQQAILDEEDDEAASDDDFIVDSEMQYQYKNSLRRYDSVYRIRGFFLRRFLYPQNFKEFDNNESDIGKDSSEYEEEEDVIKPPRKATTEEKRFERFVKRRVKGMLNEEFVKMVSIDHYVGIIQVILDIFDKYNNKENVIDIFDTSYVIQTKIDFMNSLLTKDIFGVDELELYQERIIILVLGTIIENNELMCSKGFDEGFIKAQAQSRALLDILEEKYGVREKLDRYMSKAADINSNLRYKLIKECGAENCINQIEKIYGYKSRKILFDFIKERYGENASFTVGKNNYFYIEGEVDDPVVGFKPDTDVVREVSNYARNEDKSIKGVIIVLKIGKGIRSHIASVKHTISFTYYKWNRVTTYYDGKKEMSKSMFLSY